jgi:hypothetical protein
MNFFLGQDRDEIEQYLDEIWDCFPGNVDKELVLICALMVAAEASISDGTSKTEVKRLFDVCKDSIFEELIKNYKEQ